MHTTGNMGLTVWDDIEDDFDYVTLEDNWIAVDQHDHSPGKGVQVSTGGLADKAVTSQKIANQSVASYHLQPNVIQSTNFAYRQIQSQHINQQAITPDLIALQSLTFQQMDPQIVPLGSIMMWYRPPTSAAVPGGVWELMDGRSWNQISNAWNLTIGSIPDMSGRFPLGTTPTGTIPIGSTGGESSLNLYHTHNVNPHQHYMPTHVHTIGEDGLHYHTFAEGLQLGYRRNAFSPLVSGLESWPSGDYVDVSDYSSYISNFDGSAYQESHFYQNGSLIDDGVVSMDEDGQHNHSGSVGYGGQGNTDNAGSTTDASLQLYDITNPYVGLCFIMKCRTA